MEGDRKHVNTKRVSSDQYDSSSRRLKRRKRSTTMTTTTTTVITSIHDIPTELLVEIFCRLPCVKSIFRCKLVSKSWLSLASDPDCISRFLWFNRRNKTLLPHTTFIDSWIPAKLLDSSSLPSEDSRRFEPKSVMPKGPGLKIVATWNDLALCRGVNYPDADVESDYNIINVTMQPIRRSRLVRLPPSHAMRYDEWPVGFICEPYYNENSKEYEEEDGGKRIKADYKFKVARILHPDESSNQPCYEFKIQVFSSDVGQWTEQLVPCPQGFCYCDIDEPGAVACNGSLYWMDCHGNLLGLAMTNVNSTYQFHVIKHYEQFYRSYVLTHHDGTLRVMKTSKTKLQVWELRKEELEQLALKGSGELDRERHLKIYPRSTLECLDFDPNCSDTYYFVHDPTSENCSLIWDYDDSSSIYKCNTDTREYYKAMFEKFKGEPMQIKLPWWPTPLPKLPSVCKSSLRRDTWGPKWRLSN